MAFRSLPLTLALLLLLPPLLVFIRLFPRWLPPSLLSGGSPSNKPSICPAAGSLSAAALLGGSSAVGVVVEAADGEVGLRLAGVAYTTFPSPPLAAGLARRKAELMRKERAAWPAPPA